MSDFRRKTICPCNRRNRLEYEYEPEIDELAGMNEREMERYFNVHINSTNLAKMVDKMTSNITLGSSPDNDRSSVNINSSFIYGHIRELLDRRGITVSEAEKILGITISPYTINKAGGDFTMMNNPIYRKVVDNLPMIIKTIYHTTPEKVEAEINQTHAELSDVTTLIDQVEAEIEDLTNALEFTRYNGNSTINMYNEQLNRLLQELYFDYTKFPYFLRTLYSTSIDLKEFTDTLGMKIVYLYNTWMDTKNDDIPGQIYLNIGFNRIVNDEETRRHLINRSFFMAAVEYVIMYYNYYDGYKHTNPHCCISISHRESTPDTANIIYDIHEILAGIETAVMEYIINGTPACITLNMGQLYRFDNLAFMLQHTYKNGVYQAGRIKSFMEPIILGVGIENFTKGKEYLEIVDTMKQKSTDNYKKIKELEDELDCAIAKRFDLTKKRRSLHAHLRFLRSRILSIK